MTSGTGRLQLGLLLRTGEQAKPAGCAVGWGELRPSGPRPGGPPIWIGAKRPRMMRLVARYADAYNAVWYREPSGPAEAFAHLDEARREIGRDPATIRRTSGTDVLVPDAGEAPDRPAQAIRGSVQEIAERLWAFHTEAGASHVTVILDPWTTRAIEQFGRVIEALRAGVGC